ncbi:MAG: GvpL/GvpF family gas vesicle protein [Chloroflexi bacterium]|nr:GvpL/GvpF family gas vesicle protein [Chloroflexota bacterium]
MSTLPSPSSERTYVYCVVRSDAFAAGRAAFSTRAIGGRDSCVYLVTFQDLAAVVSDSAQSGYRVSRANTMAHELVVEEAMTSSDVLPVRFGTVAKSVKEVQESLLQRRYGRLQGLFQYVRGRSELGLKVFWQREQLFREIVEEDSEIRSLRDRLADQPVEKAHYERIKLGQLAEAVALRKRDQEAQAILSHFQPLCADVKVNKNLTDTMVLNAAFLVAKSNETAFDAAVNALDVAQKDRLLLKYVGPAPPYNFVNLTIQWDKG